MIPSDLTGLYGKMAAAHPALARGLVRCETCKYERRVDSAWCLKNGWPKCCGYTMRLVSDTESPDAKP